MWPRILLFPLAIISYFEALAREDNHLLQDGKNALLTAKLANSKAATKKDVSHDERVRQAKESARRLGERTSGRGIRPRTKHRRSLSSLNSAELDDRSRQQQNFYDGEGEGKILARKERARFDPERKRWLSMSSFMREMMKRPAPTPNDIIEGRINDLIGGYPLYNPKHYIPLKDAKGEPLKDIKSGFSTVAFRQKIDGPKPVDVVVKQIHRELMDDLSLFLDALAQAIDELKALKEFREKEVLFVAEYIGAYKDKKNNFYMVIKYIRGHDLFVATNAQHDHGFKRCQHAFLVEAMAPIVVALWQLHRLGYIYHDLKIENIVKEGTDPANIRPGFMTRLIDFGLAEKPPKYNYNIDLEDESWRELSYYQYKSNTFCCTLATMAPEIADSEIVHDQKVDLWSFGIVLDMMASGSDSQFEHDCEVLECSIPHEDTTELIIDNIINKPFVFPRKGRLRKILKRLIRDDPSERPTMRELMDDPFFGGVDWRELIKSERKARGFSHDHPDVHEFDYLDFENRSWPPRSGPKESRKPQIAIRQPSKFSKMPNSSLPRKHESRRKPSSRTSTRTPKRTRSSNVAASTNRKFKPVVEPLTETDGNSKIPPKKLQSSSKPPARAPSVRRAGSQRSKKVSTRGKH